MNDLLWLSGTWFVAATTYAPWTKGDKLAPTYHFSPLEKETGNELSEEIKYIDKGDMKTIYGVNQPQRNNFKAFNWQGHSPEGMTKAKWEVKLTDETGMWMVTWHARNPQIPEGINILVRSPELDDAVFQNIKKQMQSDSVLQPHIANLKRLL